MARVDFLVQAIDRASKTFDSIARSGTVLDKQLNSVSRTTEKLDERFQRVKDSAKGAADGLARVDRASQKAADNMRLAANQGERLARWNQAAADAARNLARDLDRAQRAADAEAVSARAAADALEKLTRATLAQRAAVAGIGKSQTANAAATVAANTAATAAVNRTNSALHNQQASLATLGRGWRFLGQEVTLFAGLLPGVKVWHFVLDAIVESLAVLVPALSAVAFGLTAFGAAAFDAGREIAFFLLNIHEIHDATGKAIAPLTNNLEKLHDVVRPMVFQLFGDAILIAAKKSGLFNQAAIQTGQVLERFGNKITTAILHSQGGLEKFFEVGARDAHQFGIVLENIGKILFKLIQVSEQTHIAEFLLEGLVVASKLLALITKLPTWLLAVAFGLHGVYLWGGLAVTKAVQLISVLARFAAFAGGIRLVNTAVGTLPKNATAIERLRAVFVDLAKGIAAIPGRLGSAAKAMLNFVREGNRMARVLEALGKIPWGVWAGAAVAALAIFVIFAARARDETKKWIDELNKGILKASIPKALGAISSGQEQVASKLKDANAALAAQRKGLGDNAIAYGRFQGQTIANARAVQELSGETTKLSRDYDRFNTRLAGVAKLSKGVGDAQGLLVAAGVTTSDMLSTQKGAWDSIVVAVEATLVAYKDLGQTGTTLTNDLAVMTKTTDSQQQAVSKLNSAWSTFITNMTATQSTFDTVIQGTQTLSDAFNKAGGAGLKVSVSLGKIKDKFELTRAPIDSLTKSGVALNQAFEEQIVNIEKLFESLRQANVSQNLFKKATQDAIAPMLKYARGSKEATDQLIGLAQEAGFHGPASFKRLVEWVGNTHGAMKSLKNITNQATIQNALLNNSMDATSKLMAGKLKQSLDVAIFTYEHVTRDVDAYAKAIVESGVKSDQAAAARKRVINDLIATGHQAGIGNRAVAGMISTILKIPFGKAFKLVMDGQGHFRIGEVNAFFQKGKNPQPNSTPGGRAAGGLITGGTPGKDSVTANLMPGEVVVPTHMVNAGAVDHLRGSLPGFAAGGVVRGTPGVLAGRPGHYVIREENAYTRNAQNQMVSVMRQALTAAEKAAIAAQRAASGGGAGVAGPGGGQPAANAALARKMYPAWGSGAEWSAWNSIAMAESGWNQYARNSKSGAYGIPQALPPSKMGAAANPPQSNPHAQISWMIGYLKGRYGDPINAWQFHLNHGWYDKGGVLKPGTTIAHNNTGHDEWVVNPGPVGKPVPGGWGGGKPAQGAGGGKGIAVIVNGFGAGGESDINRIIKNLKTINDSINAASGAGGGGALGDVPPGAGGPKKGTPKRGKVVSEKIDIKGPTYDQHLELIRRLHDVQKQLVKDTSKATITGAALLKAEHEHKPKAFIDQLRHLYNEERKKVLAERKHRDSLRQKAGGIYGPNPLNDLNKELRQSRGALKEDKKELAKAIKEHAKPEWIRQLKALEKQAEAREKAIEKRIKAEEKHQKDIRKGKDDPHGGGTKHKPAPGSGGGGGGVGGGLGSGGGSSAGSAHVREEVAVLKEIRTATKEAKNELVSIRALLKKDLDEIASNTHPAKQAAATSKAMQSTAVSAGHAGQNKTRRP